jgi:hypothetical protein
MYKDPNLPNGRTADYAYANPPYELEPIAMNDYGRPQNQELNVVACDDRRTGFDVLY